MSDLIDGNKLLAKIRKRMTDTNEVIDYFDVAHFELSWIEKWILKEMKANGDETSDKPALHKHCVNARAFVESCGNLAEYVDGSKIAHRFKNFTIPVIEYNELRKAADYYDSEHVR